MVIHLYTLCWNEMDILPFVIDYWKRIPITKAVVYDNGSTDGSIEFLEQFDWIEIRRFETEGMNDSIQKDIKNKCWKESKGVADYVIVCDMDEVLFSNDFEKELKYMKDNGYNVLGTSWYALRGESKPEYKEGKLLHELIVKGYKQKTNRKFENLGKFMLFDPNKIDDMKYEVGCHLANPIPEINLYESKKIFAIHFDKGFGYEYFFERRHTMFKRLSQTNLKNNWCFEYGEEKQKIIDEYNDNVKKSINLVELFKNDNKLDIFIGTYKPFKVPVKNEVYKMIVGNHEIKNQSSLELINCKHDSKLDDRFYSELYMLKWIAENYDLKNYVGYCHYRKYFDFLNDIPDMDKIFSEYDAIVGTPIIYDTRTIKQDYANCHNVEDLYIVGGIIADKYPSYAKAWHNFINGKILIPYNMFIMKSEDFKNYIKFIFDVLDEYVNIVGTDIVKRIGNNVEKYLKSVYPNSTIDYQYRIGGYIGERLTNVFILNNFKKLKTFPIVITESKYTEKKG